jgi:hypothetical protein
MTEQYELDINVSIRQAAGYGGQLNISERVQVPAHGFLELCQVLGEFHKLAEALKAKHKQVADA